jgi:two-component system sensor histidine kinase QseC
MDGEANQRVFKSGASRRRILAVFALQTLVIVLATLMAARNAAPLAAVLAIILSSGVLSWLAVNREWLPVAALARSIANWDPGKPDMAALDAEKLASRTDADIALLMRGFHGFASRVESYGDRERNFTRDASHELRSPLTVIKMSADMLADEPQLSEFGMRSVDRIRRSARELESLVEAFLILSRESDKGLAEEDFVVNKVLRQEVEYARDLVSGRPVELVFDEPATFALHASPRVFAVLCGQLIRHALQQTDRGKIVVTVMPGKVSVINPAAYAMEGSGDATREMPVDRHGFDLAIARRLSDRFQWPLEVRALPGANRVASVSFPHPQPVDA